VVIVGYEQNVDSADVPNVGIGELYMNKLAIYPNPASGIVNIRAPYIVKSIEVLNNTGQIVFSGDVNDKTYQFNVSEFEMGFYFILIKTEGGRLPVRKLVVK